MPSLREPVSNGLKPASVAPLQVLKVKGQSFRLERKMKTALKVEKVQQPYPRVKALGDVMVHEIKVKVTKEHIEHGTPSDGGMCAIALALKEKEVFGPGVSVGGGEMSSGKFGELYLSKATYKKCDNFVNKFDGFGTTEEKSVRPMSFVVKVAYGKDGKPIKNWKPRGAWNE